MKNIATYLTIALLLLGTSCSNDFLDIPMEGEMSAGSLDTTKIENMFMPVSNAYASLRSGNVHGFSYLSMLEITSDDANKGSSSDDGPPVLELDRFTYGSQNSLISDYWKGNFDVVSAANNAIFMLPHFKGALRSDVDKKNYANYMAEVRFIRAYAYFNLNRAYGGVPIIDSLLTEEQISSLHRASANDVYAFVHRDLTFAVNNLPPSYSEDWAGRITKYTAMALKAKVFLYQNQMDSVKRYTDDIIASNAYDLYSDFYKMFRIAGKNCVESLFEIQASTLGKITGPAPFTEYAYFQGPRGNSPYNIQGWGFKEPSQALINFLKGRNDTIRYNATIMTRGTTTPDGDSIKRNCANPYYNMKAYTPSVDNKWTYNGYGFDNNIRILRFAEVLLMNAEAAVTTGGDAATPLNRVRARAGLDPIAAPTLNDVLDERRAELAMEENRFFDLVRTGRAATVLATHGFKAPKNNLFPVPQAQININENLKPQNEGY